MYVPMTILMYKFFVFYNISTFIYETFETRISVNKAIKARKRFDHFLPVVRAPFWGIPRTGILKTYWKISALLFHYKLLTSYNSKKYQFYPLINYRLRHLDFQQVKIRQIAFYCKQSSCLFHLSEMESWAWTCVILCLFGFFKDFKPSEPFLTQYLISPQWVNITLSEAYTSVYPIWTYSYLAVLVFVFILTGK